MKIERFKICLFGDGGVGKTTLIKRYTTGVFNAKTSTTIGVDFYVKKIELGDRLISLQLWDFMGQEKFRPLLPAYIKGAKAARFLFNITRHDSFQNINKWTEVFRECYTEKGFIPIFLIGSKLDLAPFRAVESFYGKKLVEQNDLFTSYFECSSKTGKNVDLIFTSLAKETLKRSLI